MDLPLGLRNERAEGVNHSVALAEGALLVLYTDGLTEATRDAVEGERRLREALARDDVYRSSTPAAAIRRAVVGESSDDVAILTVCVGPNSDRMTRWSFGPGDATVATKVRRELAAVLRSAGATNAEAADAELVFGELLGNVVRHTEGPVEAALDMTNESPSLHVLDRGAGFELLRSPSQEHPERVGPGTVYRVEARAGCDRRTAPGRGQSRPGGLSSTEEAYGKHLIVCPP